MYPVQQAIPPTTNQSPFAKNCQDKVNHANKVLQKVDVTPAVATLWQLIQNELPDSDIIHATQEQLLDNTSGHSFCGKLPETKCKAFLDELKTQLRSNSFENGKFQGSASSEFSLAELQTMLKQYELPSNNQRP